MKHSGWLWRGGGAGSGNTGDRMGDFSFLYILSYVVITFSAGEIYSIIFPMSIPELQRPESSSPFQTPSKLGIDNNVLPSGCFHETEWKMEVGEYHLPALWGCSCGQARPWVLRGSYGGHSDFLILLAGTWITAALVFSNLRSSRSSLLTPRIPG